MRSRCGFCVSFSLCVLFFVCFHCGKMAPPVTTEGATGGLPAEEDEMDVLIKRMQGLKKEERRRTLQRMSVLDQDIDYSEFSQSGHAHAQVQAQVPQAQSAHYTLDTTPRKIKNFSGAEKVGSGEVDYRHWRRAAARVIDDNDLTDSKKRLILLQSLVGAAEDAIDLHRQVSPANLIEILDKFYGTTTDGHDLLAEFYQCLQLPGQTAGDYLGMLYVKLCEVVQRGGLSMGALPETLVRQFVRGTSDEELLVKLRLEEAVEDPPDFPDLIAKVRREEARRTERRLRLKKVTRANISQISSDLVAGPNKSPISTISPIATNQTGQSEVERLQRRIAELEGADRDVNLLVQRVNQLETQVRTDNRKYFCFRCGIDGHLAYDCPNPANKILVEEKSKARRDSRRQGNWSRLPQGAGVGNR